MELSDLSPQKRTGEGKFRMKIEGIGRKVGSKEKRQHEDKKTRVAPYLDPEHFGKLKRLAIACDETPAMLALEMINYCLDHTGFVEYIQKMHSVPTNSTYRVIPIVEDGKVIY